MPFFARFLGLILLILVASAAQGRADIDDAVDLWLQGDDAKSLPMLAELAEAGDSDARMLLSRIETTDLGPSPYRLSLDAEQSRELFRFMPLGAVFGKSWMSIEAGEGNRRALAFLESLYPNPNPGVIERLQELGEEQATDYPSRIIALYGSSAMKRTLRENAGLLEELKPFLDYLSGAPEPSGDGIAALRHISGGTKGRVDAHDPDTRATAGLLSLGYGYGDVSDGNRWRPVIEEWLLTANATRPIAQLCERACPQEVASCAVAIMALNGGYFETIRLDSPLEKVIPQQRFLDSPRARLMALRRAALARNETNSGYLAEHDEIAGISACAANLITAERETYP